MLSSLVFIVESKACDGNPCGEGNKCIERGRRFKCQCKPGLYGKRCNKGELHCMWSIMIWLSFLTRLYIGGGGGSSDGSVF